MSNEQFQPGNFAEREQRLVDILKGRPFEDAEAKQALLAWMDEREAEIHVAGNPRLTIEHQLEKARLFNEAGWYKFVWDNLEGAYNEANNAGEADLAEEAKRMMDEIDANA